MDPYKKFRFFSKSFNVYVRYRAGLTRPFLVVLIPTKKCNLKCQYCEGNQLESDDLLTKEQWLELISGIGKLGAPVISFSGGEPLLHPHIFDLANFARKKGLVVNLNTNGSLIDESNAGLIADSFDTVRISLDGDRTRHDTICGVSGTYERVVRGIDLLTSLPGRKSRIGINFVITPENPDQAKELAGRFRKKVDFITFLPQFSFMQDCSIKPARITKEIRSIQADLKSINKSGNTSDFMENTSLEASRKNCDAGRLYFQVYPAGGVTACPFTSRRYGRIGKESVDEIYRRIREIGIERCNGCHATCTTEVSRVFRKNPFTLIRDIPALLKTYI